MTPALLIHGGAGAATPSALQAERRSGLTAAFEAGWNILVQGGTALDAVVQASVTLEDHPLFNAGLGSCLTEDGTVEVDASLMDGSTFQTGAVGAVQNTKNAIRLARAVMIDGRHVFLVGQGAERFAREHGLPQAAADELITPRQHQRWQALRLGSGQAQRTNGEPGTVGAVALDSSGRLAAATSTGGVFGKRSGRVGDSAVIGAGTYADSALGACSATGDGEHIIRATLARTAVELLRGGKDPAQAARTALARLTRQTRGEAGLILLDPFGRSGVAYTTESMGVALRLSSGQALRAAGRLVVRV